jgi:uncharacterized membrane protein YcjF (UPF0283 family)
MNAQFDTDIKSFFSERTAPPAETKALLQIKLEAARIQKQNKQAIRLSFIILLCTALFAAAVLWLAYTFTTAFIILLTGALYFGLTIIGGLAIIIAFKILFNKGGSSNAVIVD